MPYDTFVMLIMIIYLCLLSLVFLLFVQFCEENIFIIQYCHILGHYREISQEM